MEVISASVGRDGENLPPDVRVVQRLLNARGFPCGPVDGECGPRTIGAILIFQSTFLEAPDGRVDPGGATLRRLNELGIETEPPSGMSLTSLVPRPDRDSINFGVESASNDVMLSLFGPPRRSYAQECRAVTNTRLARRIGTADVGPFNLTGLKPALESLSEVMQDIERVQPAVYDVLGTAGMLCCRYVRNSTTAVSNHSWGTAVDLRLKGVLDARGNDRVQYGLTLIAPIFNRFGWYWGAGFSTEDAMHFEAGRDLVEVWAEIA